jgi:hypothetical protein
MPALDRYVPDFDVNEVHAINLAMPAHLAMEQVFSLPAGSDSLVRLLFRLRGIRGADLPLEHFASVVLGFDVVEQTASCLVAVGRIRRLRGGCLRGRTTRGWRLETGH